jgi:hypothetical protein
MHQRKDVLRPRQAPESVVPNIGKARSWWQPVHHQFGRPLREQDVAALGQRPQPGRPVQCLPVVVTAPQLGLPTVEGHPGGKCNVIRPWLCSERLLEDQGRSHSIGGSDEHR